MDDLPRARFGHFGSERRSNKFWVLTSKYNGIEIWIFLNPPLTVLNCNHGAKNPIDPRYFPFFLKYTIPTAYRNGIVLTIWVNRIPGEAAS